MAIINTEEEIDGDVGEGDGVGEDTTRLAEEEDAGITDTGAATKFKFLHFLTLFIF